MKHISIIALLLTLCLFPMESLSQTKKRPAPRRRPAAEPEPKPAPAMDMRTEAKAIAEQIRNVSKFLYLYGKVANGLEIADDLTKRGEMTPAAAAKNKQSRDALIANISGLRAGIDNVAKTFQANPRLQVQYLKISYAAEAATNAERMAAAGQFDEAGKALVTAIERLTDTMLALRLL